MSQRLLLKRAMAFTLDVIMPFTIYTLWLKTFNDYTPEGSLKGLPLVWRRLFDFTLLFYLLFKDGIWQGQSLSKKALDLHVINIKKQSPCSLKDSFIRNILLLVPFFAIAELVFVLERKDGRRLGDLIAGTTVVTSETIK